jgi:hypothetical protein
MSWQASTMRSTTVGLEERVCEEVEDMWWAIPFVECGSLAKLEASSRCIRRDTPVL